MKLQKEILYFNLIALLAAGIYGGIVAGSVGIGVVFCLLAIVNLPVCLYFLFSGNRLGAKTSIMILGVFLLIGFSICSTSRW